MRCEAASDSDLDWDLGQKEERASSWNGRTVNAVTVDTTVTSLYQINVIPVEYYSSNNESYHSLNDPSSQNSRDEASGSSSSYDGATNNNAPQNNPPPGKKDEKKVEQSVGVKAGVEGGNNGNSTASVDVEYEAKQINPNGTGGSFKAGAGVDVKKNGEVNGKAYVEGKVTF